MRFQKDLKPLEGQFQKWERGGYKKGRVNEGYLSLRSLGKKKKEKGFFTEWN